MLVSVSDCLTEKTWLLIYDNVEDVGLLKKYLPGCAGPVLVTTRSKELAFACPELRDKLELDVLDDHDSEEVFNKLRKYYDSSADTAKEEVETKTLLAHLGGFPLGIEQIAAYVTYKHFTIKDFLGKYERISENIHKKNQAGSTHTLATVWENHFQSIAKEDASTLLGLLAMLNPDKIPVELFLPSEWGSAWDFAPWVGNEAK